MKLLAIDGNSIANRAFYGIKALANKNGVFTNAVFGFMNIYLKHINALKPDCVAVAFDVHSPTFRHKAVSSYKANRKKAPDELIQQFPLIKELLGYMGVNVVECKGYEADDVLGTLSRICSENKVECHVLSGDRDNLQLVDDFVTVRLATNKEDIIFTPQKFFEVYGFQPINLIDCKAIMGDSSDNITGVKGIGEKGANDLVKQFTTLENIYENIDSAFIKKGMRAKLIDDKEIAFESKWLATIMREAPIDTEIENYKLKERNNAEISRLLTELEMFKLMDKLGVSVSDLMTSKQVEIEPPEKLDINFIKAENSQFIEKIKTCEYVFDGDVLSIRDGENIYTTDDKNIIIDFFESECEKSTIGAKSHYHYAFKNNSNINNLRYDAEICGYLLNTSSSEYTIEKLCGEYGCYYYTEFEQFNDLVSLKKLIEKVSQDIEKQSMTKLLEEIEMPLTEVLASMEFYGVGIDAEGVKEFGVKLTGMIKDVQQAIFDEVGHEFNISSPKQLGVVLFEELELPAKKKTKTGYSTNAEVLEELRANNPIVDNVLKYRQYTKLNSTYVVGLLKTISDDGRIHTCFKQTETRTGRISSTEPNMQNIPVRTELGSVMRKFFVADKGKVLLDADYSQIELRVMAHLCGDKNMINAFVSGEDIHTSTASQVFNMPPIMVTPEMRSAAKAVNFGIIYGMGAFSLAKDINVSIAKAKQYINDYLENFASVQRFMDEVVANAKKTATVSTMFGRIRYIPEILSSNKIVEASGKRIAMNTPVQGTAADLIKIAMINVYRRIKNEKLKAKLILQVHDELIVECENDESDKISKILHEEMINVYQMRVPLVADVNKGESWYDAKG